MCALLHYSKTALKKEKKGKSTLSDPAHKSDDPPPRHILRPPFLFIHRHFLSLLRIQPTILDRRLHPPHILLHILPVQLRRLRVCRTIRIRIVQQTLDGRQDRGHVVRRGPPVLEDVETELAVGVDVGVEHAGEEFDGGRFVRVGFVKGEDEFEGAVFKGRVGWEWRDVGSTGTRSRRGGLAWAKYHGVPHHNVIGTWTSRDTTGWVTRQSFKIANKPSSAVCRLTFRIVDPD